MEPTDYNKFSKREILPLKDVHEKVIKKVTLTRGQKYMTTILLFYVMLGFVSNSLNFYFILFYFKFCPGINKSNIRTKFG